VEWREGSNGVLSSRFARVRLHSAHRGGTSESQQEWLLIQWPEGEAEPTKYWLSTLPQDIAFERLVELAKLRWRIERDYQDLKQELGLDHFEGRSWRGFHHHASLCIAAYGFLICERETIPPSAPGSATRRPQPGLPQIYRPRDAADPARTARSQLDRHNAMSLDRGARRAPAAMSLLPPKAPFMTQ
jgi:SRSO17 transposase